MSNSSGNLTFNPNGLFQRGYLNVSQKFRAIIAEAIKKSGYSREQIVEMIELLTGIRISKYILDQTISSKKEYRFPVEVLHVFCLITGSIEPFRLLLNSIGCEVLEPSESKELKLIRLMREKEKLEKQIEKIKKEIEDGV